MKPTIPETGFVAHDVSTFAELLRGKNAAEIVCAYTNEVVRRLVLVDGVIDIDAMGDTVSVTIDTAITYEPWFMDRGSLVFVDRSGRRCKLATEGDTLCLAE